MKKITAKLLIICFLLMSMTTVAQESIVLKDGTIYSGFIAEQLLKGSQSGKRTITYDAVTKRIPRVAGMEIKQMKISEEACSPEWLAWAEEERVMDTENGQRYLVLHTLSVPGKSDVECFILSRSSDSFFCHVMEQSTTECQLQDIVRITKPVRNPALLTAVDDIIRVQTGMVYQGVITNQVFGSHYEIWNRSDNAVYTIRNDEVAAVGMKAFNPDYTLWQQTPYLQTIQTESQIFGPGFIIENTYATSRTPGTLTFLTKEGNMQVIINVSDVKSIAKSINPDYAPVMDLILNQGETMLNRQVMLKYCPLKDVSDKYFCVHFDSVRNTTPLCKEHHVVIESKDENLTDAVVVPATKRVETQKRQKVKLLLFTYADLFKTTISPVISKSINGTTKIEFDVPTDGAYFVFLRKSRQAWLLNVSTKSAPTPAAPSVK